MSEAIRVRRAAEQPFAIAPETPEFYPFGCLVIARAVCGRLVIALTDPDSRIGSRYCGAVSGTQRPPHPSQR